MVFLFFLLYPNLSGEKPLGWTAFELYTLQELGLLMIKLDNRLFQPSSLVSLPFMRQVHKRNYLCIISLPLAKDSLLDIISQK